MYSAFCAVGVIFVIFLVPETKGKKLESIASMFIRKMSQHFSRKPSIASVTHSKKGDDETDLKDLKKENV